MIATILLLGMTVTLFSAVFLLVNSFPTPQPQAVTQFQASLDIFQGSVEGVNITHGTGPIVPQSARIYLQSSVPTNDSLFSLAGGIPVVQGLPPNTTSWSAGQVWSVSFLPIPASGNLTIRVSIISNSILLYRVDLPALTVSVPPLVVASGVNPAPVPQGSNFTVFATVSGDPQQVSGITIVLSALAGLSTPSSCSVYSTTSPCSLTYNSSSGNWISPIIVTSSSTMVGTYVGFITGTYGAGQTFSGAVTIAIVSS